MRAGQGQTLSGIFLATIWEVLRNDGIDVVNGQNKLLKALCPPPKLPSQRGHPPS